MSEAGRGEPVWDPSAAGPEESAELVSLYREVGGRPEDLSGPHDLVAAIAALVLRPPGRRVSLADAAVAAGVELDVARRMWSGLGLDPDDDLTAQDIAVLEMLGAAAVLMGDSRAVELSRVAGLSTRRLADALVSLIRVGFELPRHHAALTRIELARSYRDLIEEQVPSLIGVVDTALRHHIASIAFREWDTDPTATVATRDAAVGFADLVGFTDWTASATLGELAHALDGFERAVWEAAEHSGIEIVKLIGDEVMFAAPSVDQALEGAVQLVRSVESQPAIEAVRAGLAAGDVVSRAGDLFGIVVNQAARLVAAADPGTVLVTVEAADRIGSARFGELLAVEAKGFREPIRARSVIL